MQTLNVKRRIGKQKLRVGAGKYKFRAGDVKYKLEPGPGSTVFLLYRNNRSQLFHNKNFWKIAWNSNKGLSLIKLHAQGLQLNLKRGLGAIVFLSFLRNFSEESFEKQLVVRKMFFKIVVLKNFVIFTGKDLCWRLFLLNKEGLQIYKKVIRTQVFSC